MSQPQSKVSDWIRKNNDNPEESHQGNSSNRRESSDTPPVLQSKQAGSHGTSTPDMQVIDEYPQGSDCFSDDGFDIDTAILEHEEAEVKRDTLKRRLEIKRKLQEQEMLLEMEEADEKVTLADINIRKHRVGSYRGSTTSNRSVRSIRSATSHHSVVSSNMKKRLSEDILQSKKTDEPRQTPLAHSERSSPPELCPSRNAKITADENYTGPNGLLSDSRHSTENKENVKNDAANNENGIAFLRDVFKSLQNTSGLPKTEIETFDGEPVNFYKFMHNFDAVVDKATDDSHVKLNYLIQFCRGEARESISDCVLMEDGYNSAREILRKQFGRPHMIAQTYIKKLTNGPSIKSTDGKSLHKLSSLMTKCSLTLSRLGYESDIHSTDNLLSISRRLPTSLRSKWADYADTIIESGKEPKFENLQKFVEKAARVGMSLYGQDISDNHERQKLSTPTPTFPKVTTFSTNQSKARPTTGGEFEKPKFDCLMCHQEHKLWKCPMFNSMAAHDRVQFVKANELCENCFLKGHSVRDCRRVSYCTVPWCTYKRNVLLHKMPMEHKSSRVTPDSDRHSTQSGASAASYNVTTQHSYKICMKVVPVIVQATPDGPSIATYALLDECSDATLCSESLASTLGVCGTPKTFSLTTVNNKREKLGKEISLTVRSLNEYDPECIDLSRVWTVDSIPVNASAIPVKADIERWPHLEGVDIPELDSKEVTLLIGSDVPEVFWKTEEKRGRRQDPYAVKSILGWTVIGPVAECPFHQHEAYVNYVNFEDDILSEQVERFWKTDFNDYITESQTEMSVEDQNAYDIMENSVEIAEGHYQVGLPWRIEPDLPNNKSMAEARLRLLKKRFVKDNEFHEKYTKTINEYINKGYAQKVPEISNESESQRSWYIPHHGVYNPQKPGKLRVVFDCASKYNGASLNGQLLQGPDLTNNLIGVFTRFRQGKVAVVGDIESMFHQVKVKPEDRDFLKFLWWENGDVSKDPEVYQMTVHLFGATSSPSVCSYALRKTATDNAGEFDVNTTETIRKNFYVDDCLKSVDDKQDAIRLVEELRDLLSKGGFRLTKWISNDKDVISSVPESERAVSVVNLDMDKLPIERALGVQWNVETDCFEFRSIDKEKPVMRRGILSVLSSLYDPLGFASPVVLTAKLILQKLCKDQLGWDESLDDETCNEWSSWVESLAALSTVKLPRWFKSPELTNVVSIELHHFADASSTGYGCVSYLRFVDDGGHIHCSFVMGKSRLAPIKTVTIPRLELSAAVVAVKMDGIIKRELEFEVDKTIFWTDSTSVIQYIENRTSRYKTFVANRLSIIHGASTPLQWKYVDTKSNPADHASRGFKPTETDKFDVWLHGPEFLWKEEGSWPQNPAKVVRISDEEIEVKNIHLNITSSVSGMDSLLDRYSSWYALQKSVAWLLRYKDFCIAKYIRSEIRTQLVVQTGELSVIELEKSTLAIVNYVQLKYFPDEMKELNKGQFLKKGSLVKLSPILCDGVMRVGGRLQRAPLSDDIKHPIILPSKSHVTDIIIRHFHHKEGHSGVHHVLSVIRGTFWVVKGVASVKRVLSGCFTCKRRDAPHCEQYMAPLPYERIQPDLPPFTHVGVDFFGPMNVRGGRRTTAKRYGCLFTCLTTRAVHIEIAHSLSTDSFICALNRFIARRGKPVTIYSDNGTNFKGGDSEIRHDIQAWNQEVISDTLRQKEIRWVYSPPRAPHFGGSWERLVRSTKRILKCLLSEQLVTDEALLTFMAEVEKILNDRPLTTPSQDSKDEEALTPNRLLLLKGNPCLPHGVFDGRDVYVRRRWRQSQYLSNVFWRRWIKEYLPSLQIRHKWTLSRKNVKIGDIVLVDGENTPRGQWPLGRVVDVFPDADGFVRSVSLRVNNKIKRRPVSKLCMLESNVDDNGIGESAKSLHSLDSHTEDVSTSDVVIDSAKRKSSLADNVSTLTSTHPSVGGIADTQRSDATEDTERIDVTQDAEKISDIEDAALSGNIEGTQRSDVTEDTERIDATQDAEKSADIEDAALIGNIEDAARSGGAVDVNGRDDITTEYLDCKKVNGSCGLPKVVMRRCAVADNLALSSAQPPVGRMHDLDTGLRRCPARIRASPRHLDDYV